MRMHEMVCIDCKYRAEQTEFKGYPARLIQLRVNNFAVKVFLEGGSYLGLEIGQRLRQKSTFCRCVWGVSQILLIHGQIEATQLNIDNIGTIYSIYI